MSEFVDDDETLDIKLDLVAEMIRKAAKNGRMVVYTGAGISTAAGLGDYASRLNSNSLVHKLDASKTNGGFSRQAL